MIVNAVGEIPAEIEEAAHMDGARLPRLLFRVVLPLQGERWQVQGEGPLRPGQRVRVTAPMVTPSSSAAGFSAPAD